MICERCGRQVSEFWVLRHEEMCLGRQDVRILTMLSLVDPLRPGWARTTADYDRTRLHGSASIDTLRNYFGTWRKAVNALGLLAPDMRRKRGKC